MGLYRTSISSVFSLFTASIMTACSVESDEKLIKFVESAQFDTPVFYMERRGDFYTDKWHKTVLYFGYGGDWNFRACEEDAARLNKDIRGPEKFRCVKGN